VKIETREVLERSALLRFVPPDRRAELINRFDEQRFAFGEVIIRQGDDADAFYVITSGRARVVKKTEDGTELPLNMLKAGDEFGEAALLSQDKRSATIRASSTVETARLDRDRFLSVLEKHPEMRHYLELSARWRSRHGFLCQFSNFGRLPAKAIQALVEHLEPAQFPKDSRILKQGAPPGPIYIIRQGKVQVIARQDGQDRNLAFLREGDFFGELSILNNSARVAFNSLLAMAYAGLLRTLGSWDELQRNLVLLHRLNDIFEQEPEQGHDRSRLQPVPTLEGRIELRNLSFRFGGPDAQPILDGINPR